MIRILSVLSVLSVLSFAQTTNVTKLTASDRLTGNLKVPSGKTLTIESGATLNATGATITGITASAAWADITGKPSVFAPDAHTQDISTINGLQAELNGKQPLSLSLSALSLVSSTPYGRGLLATADAAALRSANGLNDAANITTGAMSLARLSITGTPDGTKFLRDDGSWQSISTGLTIGTTAITGGTSGRLLTSGATVGELTLGSGVSTLLTTPTLANLNAATTDADAASLAANTFSGVQTFPAGTVSAPAINVGDADTGIYRPASAQIGFTVASTQRLRISAANLLFTSSGSGTDGLTLAGAGGQSVTLIPQFGGSVSITGAWQSRTDSAVGRFIAHNSTAATTYFILTDDASAGRLQLGLDSATPVAQMIKAPDAVGTNIAGAPVTIAGGRGTGSASGGDFVIQTAPAGSSGSAAGTLTTRVTVKASGVVNIANMPTSATGLSSGDLWNNSGVVNIVP